MIPDNKNKKNSAILFILFTLLFSIFFILWMVLFIKNPEGSQRGVFLTDSNDWFMDWFNVVYYSIGKKPYTWGLIEERSLPPLTFFLLYPFSWLYPYDITGWIEGESRYTARYSQLPIVFATIIFLISYLLLFYSLSKNCRTKSEASRLILFSILFFSGVNLFCIERGNLQVITAAAVFLYIYLCYRSDNSSKIINAVGIFCLAFAASIKLFPAIAGVLLLYKKRWRQALFSFITGLILFFIPFLWMDQPFPDAVRDFFIAINRHAESYRTIADFGLSTPVIMKLTHVSYNTLQIIAYCLAVIALSFAWLLDSEWKRIMLVTLVLVLTSGQQGYYCLMFLFLPILMFFDEEHSLIDAYYVLLFVILLSPLQRTVNIRGAEISSRTVINFALILLYIVLLAQACQLAYLKAKEAIYKERGGTHDET